MKAKKRSYQKLSDDFHKQFSVDCTKVFNPKGKSEQRSPLNKAALQKYSVEQWARFSVPIYENELMLADYHLIRDKGTSKYYIHPNKLGSTLGTKRQNSRLYQRQTGRKPIETFYKASDSRFDLIDKSPKCLSNVKKVTGV